MVPCRYTSHLKLISNGWLQSLKLLLFISPLKTKESKLETQTTFVTEFAEVELERKSKVNANLLSICGDVFPSFLTKQIPNFLFLTVPDTFSNCMLCWPLLLTKTQTHSCQFSSVACHYTDLDKFAYKLHQQWQVTQHQPIASITLTVGRVVITTLSQELFFTVKTIMAECDLLDVLKSEETIAKVTKFLQEGCGCSRGSKGG